MARPATGRRSRIVRLLRIGFPLVAAGLLAAVFLSGEPPVTDATLTFSEADLENMRAGLQITNPQLSGASMGGDIYDFQASIVRPRNLDFEVADIEDLVGTIDYVDGPTVFIASKSAEINLVTRLMVLETGIALRTSDGYSGNADRIEVDGQAGRLTATGNVLAEGPIGRISAERLVIAPADPDKPESLGKDTVLRFEDRVRLTYIPQVTDGADQTKP